MKVYFINIRLGNVIASNRVISGASLSYDPVWKHNSHVILSSLQTEIIAHMLDIKEKMHE